ncbi:MAG: tripartite tricarboxylate transporter TctB family protein [Sphaerochaeta sp.]|nr:tripartite tricarboxylate transporter TctB family protein [Sphaerochaeta sp.]
MRETKRVDFWTGVVLMLVSVGVWILTANLPVPKRGIGPGSYPRVVAAILFLLGLVTSVSNIQGGYPKASGSINWVHLGRAALLAVMSLVYVRLLNLIGFPLLTPFFLFSVIMLFGFKRWKMALLVSIGTTAVIFILFNIVFMVFLPVGRFF